MSLIINLIPLLVIVALLFRRKHMLVAGFAGGALAVIIGGISVPKITELFVGGVSNMLSITVPILYAATAAMVAKSGSIVALVELAQRSLKSKIAILAGIITLIQGFATYAGGTAAGNTMVTAPLLALAVGAIPEVVVAMAIIGAVGFTTSPASTETALAAESAGVDVVTHANAMLPFTIAFYILAVGLAIFGVYRRGSLIKQSEAREEQAEKAEKASSSELFKRAIPFILLLLMVVFGNTVNRLVGVRIFSPAIIVILTTILTILFSPLSMDETSSALIEGSRFILTTLFGVGIFLGFINMIAELGTFRQLAALAGQVPDVIILPVAMILAFLIAIPSGAFAAGVLTLILPTLATLGLPSLAMGFVAIATGLGTQLSPVQINVAALSQGFGIDIIKVVKGNTPYILGMLALTIAVAMIAV